MVVNKHGSLYLRSVWGTMLILIVKRSMPAYKVGRLWKFKLSEVNDWVRSDAAEEESASQE